MMARDDDGFKDFLGRPSARDLVPNCKHQTEEMFPSDAMGVYRAKDICFGVSAAIVEQYGEQHDCPLRHECAASAMSMDEHHGVWAGLSERERRRLSRSGGVGSMKATNSAQTSSDRQQRLALEKGVRPRDKGPSQGRVRLSWEGNSLYPGGTASGQ